MKPDNNLLVYGLGDGEWTLSIRLDDAVDDIFGVHYQLPSGQIFTV